MCGKCVCAVAICHTFVLVKRLENVYRQNKRHRKEFASAYCSTYSNDTIKDDNSDAMKCRYTDKNNEYF